VDQTPDALLELTVLGGVNESVDSGFELLIKVHERRVEVLVESVDTTVSFHQHDGEVVIPTGEVDVLSDVADERQDLHRGCADDISDTYHQRCDSRVPPGRV